MISGLSYGARTGSLAYPLRPSFHAPRYNQALLRVVLELVHPGHFNQLPPSPCVIASKGVDMGLATFREFFN